MSTVTISETAANRIRQILADETAGSMLRISVMGGGCSGFQYSFAIDDQKMEDDLVFERDDVTILIDPMSIGYMAGAEIDWVDDLVGSSFRINNPNATAACGCGTSFAV